MRTRRRKCAPRPLWLLADWRYLASAFLVLVTASLCCAAVDYEPFAYTSSELHGQNGSTVWGGPWTTQASTSNTLSNDGISLSFPVPFEGGYTAAGTSGSRVSTGGFGSNAVNYRLLSETIPLNQDGTTRFASALFRKNFANGSALDNILLEFHDGVGNRRWGFGIQGVDDRPWLNANGSSTGTGPAIVAGQTYFLVTKIVAAASQTSSDIAYLKIFGTNYGTEVPLTEPQSWDITLTEMSGAILDRVRVRIDSANPAEAPGEIDEIRVGSTWAEVLGPLGPPPPPAGDYNDNGVVDAADYVVWRQNVNGPGGTWALGDHEPDNDVDAADYDYWRANYGTIAASGSDVRPITVPESSAVAFLLTSLLPVAAVRRRIV